MYILLSLAIPISPKYIGFRDYENVVIFFIIFFFQIKAH